MKKLGIILTVLGSLYLIINIIVGVKLNYKYSNEYSSYWDLAEKSSTIEKKSEYIDMYIDALESSGLKGKYNAIWLKTPDNSFDENMKALKSLQSRLHEIKNMDSSSFEYNTAIEQITAQEQGEANDMNYNFRSIWKKEHYPMLWNWIGWTSILLTLVAIVIGIYLWAEGDYL
jgi:hypothetical protein